jgi:transcriptional regulator with XRE-family HTH domain
MDYPKLFGKRVKAVRKAAKLTQDKAAEKAGLNPKYLGQIERAEKRPSFEVILALAKALDVQPAVLFQFDREGRDEKALQKRIESLVQKSHPEQLRLAHRVLKSVLEP